MHHVTKSKSHPRFVCGVRTAVLGLGLLAIAPACQWADRWGNSGDLLVGRSGISSTFEPPGANPGGANGIERHVPKVTEDNIVDVRRVGGAVGVRPAGERGVRNLDYYRPRIQTGPGGVILSNPGGTARMTFSEDTTVTVHDTSLVWIGNWEDGEPWVTCDRLTYLELSAPLGSKFSLLELPGGARLRIVPQSKLKISMERDRYYRIRNDGVTNLELYLSGRSTWIKPADWMDLPVVRNAPANASAGGSTIQIGEAKFTTDRVEFDASLDGRSWVSHAAGDSVLPANNNK